LIATLPAAIVVSGGRKDEAADMIDRLRLIATTTVVALQLSQAPTRSAAVLVTAVFDGDTIDVATIGHVRLLGIDAPEVTHGLDTAAPFAREARERLADLVLRRYIRLEFEGVRDDVYGRRLAYLLTEDGTFINAVLLREGLARISTRLPLSRLDQLRRAEAEAQAFRRGMWGAPPQIPPSPEYGARKLTRAKGRTPPRARPAKPRAAKTPRKPRGKIVVKKRDRAGLVRRTATDAVASRDGESHPAVTPLSPRQNQDAGDQRENAQQRRRQPERHQPGQPIQNQPDREHEQSHVALNQHRHRPPH
jgi:endonuclease YncB( thermonuclease family)